MQKILSLAVTICLTAHSLFSQQINPVNQHWCGSVEAMEAHFKKHPELKQQFEVSQVELNKAENTSAVQKTAAVDYTIPVVFHVLHVNGNENISDAQIHNQMAIFNRDFNLQNADTSLVIAPMKSAIGNVHFTFVLAKLDPNGNCTSGIDRIFDPKTNSWEGDFQDYIYTWDPTMYLNIYVVKGIESGAAGYAYYPGSLGTGSPMDAILILQNYVGSIGTGNVNQSRALTHEVGHWFNLQHVWGNSNNPGVACGNDAVGDTPLTKGYTSCSTLLGSQICTPGVSENYQNYMDYSYCSVMFTNGQATRMTNALNSSNGGRNNLASSSNLAATGITPPAQCAPAALFKSDKQVICAGQSITYTDQSNIAAPTGWTWSFEGGTPNTSNVQNPTITYNNPGTYSVQLVSSNSVGNSTPEVKTGYVIVLPAPVSTSIYESFETSTLPNSIWSVKNISATNTNWQQTSTAAATGNKSVIVSQTVAPSSMVELYSPTYNFNAMPNVALTFKWAGAERDTTTHTSYDSFSIYFSTTCGASWVPRLTKNIKATTAGVSGIVNGNFNPTPAQFHQEVITIGSLASATNVLFRIRYTSEAGSSNNFYIDDINLSTVTSLKETMHSLLNLNVFPNPANQNISVAFDLLEDKKVEITLDDVLGRAVRKIAQQTLGNGYHLINIPVSDLSKGIYFVKMNVDNAITTQKIIVE
ncbi:MAG: M43 family zinc metalloprotease [Bacteroidota bacterium]